MADHLECDACDLPAGVFSSWLSQIQDAIRGQRASEVPCGDCTACCTASQFIHIGPGEVGTLSRIPAELLFPAPRLPRGHVLLGYDEQGHCPMLVESRCTIYEDRPRTCRTYDCRVFAAAGLEVEEAEKSLIAERVRCWRFSFPSPADRDRRDAVRAAAAFLAGHAGLLPEGAQPTSVTQLAVLAVEIHDLFLRRDEDSGRIAAAHPEPELVRAAVLRRRGRAASAGPSGRPGG